jgi:CpeT/CpcT family protein DUF1001
MVEFLQGHPRARGRARLLLCLLLSAAVVSSLFACAARRQTKEQELNLVQMMRWLPGTYSNVAQHEADVKAGKPPHEALAIAIVPIDSPIMGPHAFYLQEMAADDPRRVMLQQVLSFELTDQGKIKESVATLVEPRRWRDGHLNPELFTAMVVEDLVPLSGCDLFWTRSSEGFVGADEPLRCHTASHTSEAAARTQFLAELRSTEFWLAEQSYDASGGLMRGRADDPMYRFRKGSSEHKP